MPLSLTCGVGRVGGVSPVARGGSRRSAPSARAHGGRAAARPLGSEYLSGHKGSLGNVMQVSFKGPCRRAAVTRAGMDDAPMGMDMETALGILGVSESATFDQIVSAKNVALQSAGDDDQVKVQIEQAYDLMLMKSLSQRKSGEVVDSSVRFADVRKSKPVGQQVTALLDKIPGGGLGVETPKKTSDSWKQQVAFAVLATAALAQGFPNDGPTPDDAPGAQLAVAFGLSIYFLREKKNLKLSRAALLSGAGLVGGALVGGLIQGFLHVDIVPLPLIDAPVVLVSIFSILGMWASSTFLF